MLNDTKWFISALGGMTALSIVLGSAALAQGTSDNDAIVPETAKVAKPTIGVVDDDVPAVPEKLENNEAVAESLISQGFTDIHILRQGAKMTVTAMRDGQPIELIYNVANGTLLSIDGQELDPKVEGDTGGGDSDMDDAVEDMDDGDNASGDESTEDESTEDDATEDDTTDDGTGDDATGDDATDDGTADDGETADTGSEDDMSDDGATDAGDASDDTGGDSDSDTDSSGDTDSGSDSDSDSDDSADDA